MTLPSITTRFRALVVGVIFAAFPTGPLVAATDPDPDLPALYKTLVDADTRGAYTIVVRLYQKQGIEVPGVIEFNEQSPYELLSLYSSTYNRITQSRLLKPGEGRPYWENWSRQIAGGQWNHQQAFPTDEEARLVGNFALLGILTHEVAHAICDHHDLNIHGDPYEELLADEYAVRMMKVWASHPPLAQLLEKYHTHVAGGLRMAVPDAERITLPRATDTTEGIRTLADLRKYCAGYKFPGKPSKASYVSLQLDRQRFLLEYGKLDSLQQFLMGEIARRPVRQWTKDEVSLKTVGQNEVPAWMLVEGSPATFWGISDEKLRAAIAQRLELADATTLGDFKTSSSTLWNITGPDRALLYLYRTNIWQEQPGRLIEITRDAKNPDKALTISVLAESDTKPRLYPGLLVDGKTVVLSFCGIGKVGIVFNWKVLDAATRQFVAGPLDGLPIDRLENDGELASWGILPGNPLIRGDAVIISDGPRIRLVRDKKIVTLAGDIRGYKDGQGAANVRLAGAKLLGLHNNHYYLSTKGDNGPVLRQLDWKH